MAGELLTTEEVAALLRVHPKHVYRLLKRGLPARRVGAEWRFDRREVLRWSGAAEPTSPGTPDAARTAPPIVAANGDVAVAVLLRMAAERGPPLLGFLQADMARGVELLAADAILATGAHAGGFPTHVAGDRLARIHLVRRDVGLAAPRGADVPGLAQLPRLRLASRPPSAGVREHLDRALRDAGVDAAAAHARALILPSHLDVAAAVAAGRADVGLVSRAWAERLGLSFRRLASEDYGLLVRARDLGEVRVVRLCEVAQGRGYRDEVSAVPGYDATGAGEIKYDGA